jgi:hypothetical protein
LGVTPEQLSNYDALRGQLSVSVNFGVIKRQSQTARLSVRGLRKAKEVAALSDGALLVRFVLCNQIEKIVWEM